MGEWWRRRWVLAHWSDKWLAWPSILIAACCAVVVGVGGWSSPFLPVALGVAFVGFLTWAGIVVWQLSRGLPRKDLDELRRRIEGLSRDAVADDDDSTPSVPFGER